MLGQRQQPASYHHVARLMPEAKLREALATLQGNIRQAVEALPDHARFLALAT